MKPRKRSLLLLALCACLYLMTGITAYGAEEPAEEEYIANGVHIEDMDLSGMSVEDAQDMVNAYVEALKRETMEISYRGETVSVTLQDLDFQWTNPDIVEQIAVLGNTGNILERYKENRDLENTNVTLEIEYTWDREILAEMIRAEAEARQVEPIRAEIVRDHKAKEFVITESVTGISYDAEATMEAVEAATANGWMDQNLLVEAVVTVTEPDFTTEMAQSIQDVLGEYQTTYNAGQTDRSENLRVACSYIDGVVLLPGESLSFFDYLYPVTSERGYRAATAYQAGRYIESLGGGLCQVSTTCYNAVLYAELEVVARSQHSMTVSYVDPGLDSGQAWSSGRNLIFANNTETPVYVDAYLYTNKQGTSYVYIGLWGKETRPENRTVEYISEYTTERPYAGQYQITFDPTLPYYTWVKDQGEYPKVVAMAYKCVYVDGKLESKTALYDEPDRYKATPAYWTLGTGGMTQEEFMASLPEGTVLQPPEV